MSYIQKSSPDPDPVKFGALGHTENVLHQKYKYKKESFKNYLKYLLNKLLKNISSFEVQSPRFDQKPDPKPLFVPVSDRPSPSAWQSILPGRDLQYPETYCML